MIEHMRPILALVVGVLLISGCDGSSDESLEFEDTYWRLVRIDGKPVDEGEQGVEPHLIFDKSTGRMGGSGGCNIISATYSIDGEKLELGEVSSTLRACAEGMEIETEFLNALQEASIWNIEGDELEFHRRSGQFLMRFVARPS